MPRPKEDLAIYMDVASNPGPVGVYAAKSELLNFGQTCSSLMLQNSTPKAKKTTCA